MEIATNADSKDGDGVSKDEVEVEEDEVERRMTMEMEMGWASWKLVLLATRPVPLHEL